MPLTCLNELEVRRALPVVVVPLDEVCDRYGRLRLRARDERDHPVEMFVLRPVDLRGPLLWMPGETKMTSRGEVEVRV
jgi:hypothetical protein